MLQSVVLVQLLRSGEELEAIGTTTVLCKDVGLIDVNFELSKEGKGKFTLTTLVRFSSHVGLYKVNEMYEGVQ